MSFLKEGAKNLARGGKKLLTQALPAARAVPVRPIASQAMVRPVAQSPLLEVKRDDVESPGDMQATLVPPSAPKPKHKRKSKPKTAENKTPGAAASPLLPAATSASSVFTPTFQGVAHLTAENFFSTTTPTSPKPKKRNELPPTETVAQIVAKYPRPVQLMATKFSTGGISFGAIGDTDWDLPPEERRPGPHSTIASGVNQTAMAIHQCSFEELMTKPVAEAGPYSDSGEGGEHPARDGTVFQSRAKQAASGFFDFTGRNLGNPHVRIVVIKINQGAKPRKPGQLPGPKNTKQVAKVRLVKPGLPLVSPAPHQDLYSVEDLGQKIRDIKSINPNAEVYVKIVAGEDVETVALAIAKAGGHVLLCGPGGTGAADQTSLSGFAMPWEVGLRKIYETLKTNGYIKDYPEKSPCLIRVAGEFRTGEQVAKAIALGANGGVEFGTKTLIDQGCIWQQKCHLNICSKGIATTNQELINEKFEGTPEDASRGMMHLAESAWSYLEPFGFKNPDEAVGQAHRILRVKGSAKLEPEAVASGLHKLLQPIQPSPLRVFVPPNAANISSYTEQSMLSDISKGVRKFEYPAGGERSFGGLMNHMMQKDLAFKQTMLTGAPVNINFTGDAGPSFGLVLPQNVQLGADNSADGTGKGCDGGDIVIRGRSGNNAMLGASRGSFMAIAADMRCGTLNGGAKIAVENAGDLFAEFWRGGQGLIIGNPEHYTKAVPNYTPHARYQRHALGAEFASGAISGQFFMPKKLYEEMVRLGHLSETAGRFAPQSLTPEECGMLQKWLQEYATKVQRPWVSSLAEGDAAALGAEFVKLDPEKLLAKPVPMPEDVAAPRRTSAPISLQANPSLKDIFTPAPLLPVEPVVSKPVESKREEAEKDSCGVGYYFDKSWQPSREALNKVLTMVEEFATRGARNPDGSADGWGVRLFGFHSYFQKKFPHLQLEKDYFAVLPVNLPFAAEEQGRALTLLQKVLQDEGFEIAGERDVPTDRHPSFLSSNAAQYEEQLLRQVVVKRPPKMELEAYRKALVRAQVRFKLLAQLGGYKVMPTIFSASPDFIVYKSKCPESVAKKYFKDFADPDFVVCGGAAHTRFATNRVFTPIEGGPPSKGLINVHSHEVDEHNGEIANIGKPMDELENDPRYKELLGVDKIDLSGFSDSNVMSLWACCQYLLGQQPEEIVSGMVHMCSPAKDPQKQYNNLHHVSFQGPLSAGFTFGGKTLLARGPNGFRPFTIKEGKTAFYAGSEPRAVQMPYETTDSLPTDEILVIDHTTGKIGLYEPDPAVAAARVQSLQEKKRLPPVASGDRLLTFSEAGLQLRMAQAGWNKEIQETYMIPYFTTAKPRIFSMGPQPSEFLGKGPRRCMYRYLKGKFPQVTNPPMDPELEGRYMSMETLVGEHKLDTPIVDTQRLAVLMRDSKKAAVVDINYPLRLRTDAMLAHIELVKNQCVALARAGTKLIVLSDLSPKDEEYGPVWSPLVAKAVTRALRQAGLRDGVKIALQAGDNLLGEHSAANIAIGDVDVICPYLTFEWARQRAIKEVERVRTNVADLVKQGVRAIKITNKAPIKGKGDGSTIFLEDLSILKGNDPSAIKFSAAIAEVVAQELLQDALSGAVSVSVEIGDVTTTAEVGGVAGVLPKSVKQRKQLHAVLSQAWEQQLSENMIAAHTKEVASYAAGMGVATLEGYRGSGLFSALGLAKDVTDALGLAPAPLDGAPFPVGMQQLSRFQLTRYLVPDDSGTDSIVSTGRAGRPSIWSPEVVHGLIQGARGNRKAFQSAEAAANAAMNTISSYLEFAEPTVFCAKRPMRVVVVGAGVAGLDHTKRILEELGPIVGGHIQIDVVTENYLPELGLVKNGVAPDHPAIKSVATAVAEPVLHHDKVDYFGGVRVVEEAKRGLAGGQSTVTWQELRESYDLVIDCSGAKEPRRLGVPGEDSPGVMDISELYLGYNGAFRPDKPINSWPLKNTASPTVYFVGGGNAGLDGLRILHKDPRKLQGLDIDPAFVKELKVFAPTIMRTLIRKGPHQTQYSLKELNELQVMCEEQNIQLRAEFNPDDVHLPSKADREKMSPEERKRCEEQDQIYRFFHDIHSKHKDKDLNREEEQCKRLGRKLLIFDFNKEVVEFTPKGDEVAGKVRNTLTGEIVTNPFYVAGNWIKSLGKQPPKPNPHVDAVGGWATGDGGTVAHARSTGEVNIAKLKKRKLQPRELKGDATWKMHAITKQQRKNMQAYIKKHGPVRTREEFLKARDYQDPQERGEAQKPAIAAAAAPVVTASSAPPAASAAPAGTENKGTPVPVPKQLSSTAKMLYPWLKENVGLVAACDGEKNCGECVAAPSEDIGSPSALGQAVLSATGGKGVLTCDGIPLSKAAGKTLFFPSGAKLDMAKVAALQAQATTTQAPPAAQFVPTFVGGDGP